jgi:hypothetical protein
MPQSLLRLRPRRLFYRSASLQTDLLGSEAPDMQDEPIVRRLSEVGMAATVRELHVYSRRSDCLDALAGFVATQKLVLRLKCANSHSYDQLARAVAAMATPHTFVRTFLFALRSDSVAPPKPRHSLRRR